MTESTVLLSDATFLEGTWERAAEMLAKFHPRAAMVLIIDEVDKVLWAAASHDGVEDLVWKPIRMGELRRAIQTAHSAKMEAGLLHSGAASRKRSGSFGPS